MFYQEKEMKNLTAVIEKIHYLRKNVLQTVTLTIWPLLHQLERTVCEIMGLFFSPSCFLILPRYISVLPNIYILIASLVNFSNML